MKGMTLLELVISMGIASVGSLAVFTLFLHWQAYSGLVEAGYVNLEETMIFRPQPLTDRRFTFSACSLDQAGLIIE